MNGSLEKIIKSLRVNGAIERAIRDFWIFANEDGECEEADRAAQEVADLRAALADARKVIEPFRKFVRVFEETTAKTHDNSHTLAYADVSGDTSLTLGDLRAAAEWLAKYGGG